MNRLAAALDGVSPLHGETAVRADMRCKICDGCDIRDFDLVDANKICSGIDPYAFGLSGVGVRYVRCGTCGFIFTSEFDDWDDALFARHVYNDDYIKVDGDYREARPRQWAEHVAKSLRDIATARILDYGSGAGAFTEEMARRGFAHVASYDRFAHPGRPGGLFDVITCIETIEHAPDPIALLTEIAGLLAPGGGVLIQTGMQPPDIGRRRGRWWYIAPRNGHISIFGYPSLEEAARRAGLALYLGADRTTVLGHASEGETPILAALGGGSIAPYAPADLPDHSAPDRLADAASWFDAAIVAPAQEALRRRPSRLRSALGWVARALAPGRSPAECAEEARAAEQWERAARFYADALIAEPGARVLWEALAEMLYRAGCPDEAAFARRQAGP